MKHDPVDLAAVAAFAGLEVTDRLVEALERYAAWLAEEAIPAGGLGPGEASDIWRRHLLDSLTFGAGWRRPHPPATIVDLGTGVGLPGIPLGMAFPASHTRLIDRSGRRCALARRAVRVLGLEGFEVVCRDFLRHPPPPGDLVVARAALPPGDLLPTLRETTAPAGVAVVGGSRTRRPRVAGFEPLEVPRGVLDPGSWLLIMAPP